MLMLFVAVLRVLLSDMKRIVFLLSVVSLFSACERKEPETSEVKSDPLQQIGSGDLSSVVRVVGMNFVQPDDGDANGLRPSGFSLLRPDGFLDTALLEEIKVKEAILSRDQIARLKTAVYEETEVFSAAACYDPHHIFIFYDGEDQIVNVVEVCFSCTSLQAFPELGESQWRRHDFRALLTLCEEIGILSGVEVDQYRILWDEPVVSVGPSPHFANPPLV